MYLHYDNEPAARSATAEIWRTCLRRVAVTVSGRGDTGPAARDVRQVMYLHPMARRRRRALAEAMQTGLRPSRRGRLWIWLAPGWQYGPDTPERRAQAVPLAPCPHPETVDIPDGTLCLSCCRIAR